MKHLIALLLLTTNAFAGTGSLPQVSAGTIHLTHVNDIRSALAGDMVPRDGAGTSNDNASNLGQSTKRWSNVYATQYNIVNASGGNAITLAAPSSPNAYTITPATALPASSQPVWISTAGALTYAKPALGQQVSSACTSYSMTGSFADVTNLSVTITTTGRPVVVALTDDGSGTDSYISNTFSTGYTGGQSFDGLIELKFFRDASPIALFSDRIAGTANSTGIGGHRMPASSFIYLDVGASAASHTYKVQAKTSSPSSGTGSGDVTHVVLYAYEL